MLYETKQTEQFMGYDRKDDARPSEVSAIFKEMDALNAALAVVEQGADRAQAQELVRDVLAGRDKPRSLTDHAVTIAMRRIAGKRVWTPPGKIAGSWEKVVTQTTALAWMDLMTGYPQRATKAIRKLKVSHSSHTKANAVHLLSLSYWGQGVLHLAQGEAENSLKYFRRAIDLGAQCGTESHPIVSWCYAATFFFSPKGDAPVRVPQVTSED